MLRPCLVALLISALPAAADPPEIRDVVARQTDGFWRFDVTIAHGDTGWDHYADAWRVVDANGTELGLRNLAHPHVAEQPFTRSLSNVRIPGDLNEVGIQARDNVTGWSPDIKMVKLR